MLQQRSFTGESSVATTAIWCRHHCTGLSLSRGKEDCRSLAGGGGQGGGESLWPKFCLLLQVFSFKTGSHLALKPAGPHLGAEVMQSQFCIECVSKKRQGPMHRSADAALFV